MRIEPLITATVLSAGAAHGESASCEKMILRSPPRPLPDWLKADPLTSDKVFRYDLALAHEYSYDHPPTASNLDELREVQDRLHPGEPIIVKPGNFTKMVTRMDSPQEVKFEWNPHEANLFVTNSSIGSKAVSAANGLFGHEPFHARYYLTNPEEFHVLNCFYHPLFESAEELRVELERRNSEPDKREGEILSHLHIPLKAKCVIDNDVPPISPELKKNLLTELGEINQINAHNDEVAFTHCNYVQSKLRDDETFLRLRETSDQFRKAVIEGRSIDPHTLTNYEHEVFAEVHNLAQKMRAPQEVT